MQNVGEEMTKTRVRIMFGSVLGLAAGVAMATPAPVGAANSPAFRDCSLLISGFDPDFVKVSGAMPGSGGDLVVPASKRRVRVTASESAEPGDGSHEVAFHARVTAPGVAPHSASGSDTGLVTLKLPLAHSRRGMTYTISWNAVFDNGMHACPSQLTPENTKPMPFTIDVQ
jgi:hypothetical protein